METIIKNTIVCGQNDLKDMSITQNGTLTVHTAEGVELPHVKVENSGDGRRRDPRLQGD